MPLILAIVADQQQAAQLAALVQGRLAVDLVEAAEAGEALLALNDRVPDLILTSPLMSPFDDGVLDEYLRDLGQAGAHVQTLRIPVLSHAPTKTPRLGFSLRRRPKNISTPDGCDPNVFADEIAQYLARAAEEKRNAAPQTDQGSDEPPVPSGMVTDETWSAVRELELSAHDEPRPEWDPVYSSAGAQGGQTTDETGAPAPVVHEVGATPWAPSAVVDASRSPWNEADSVLLPADTSPDSPEQYVSILREEDSAASEPWEVEATAETAIEAAPALLAADPGDVDPWDHSVADASLSTWNETDSVLRPADASVPDSPADEQYVSILDEEEPAPREPWEGEAAAEPEAVPAYAASEEVLPGVVEPEPMSPVMLVAEPVATVADPVAIEPDVVAPAPDPVIAAPPPTDPVVTHKATASFRAALAAIRAAWNAPSTTARAPETEARETAAPHPTRSLDSASHDADELGRPDDVVTAPANPSGLEIDLTGAVELLDDQETEEAPGDLDQVDGAPAAEPHREGTSGSDLASESVDVYELTVGQDLRELESQLLTPYSRPRGAAAAQPDAPVVSQGEDAVERPVRTESSRKRRGKRSKRSAMAARGKPRPPGTPVQDEWGIFDPNQCGFAALVDKLDEVSDEKTTADRRTKVRLISHG